MPVLKCERPILGSLCLVLLIQATACGSSDNLVRPAEPRANFTGSGNPATANMVRLLGTASNELVTVSAAIAGPTTSSDLYSFAFDLLLGDPTVARLENGSATFGTALTLSGNQSSQVMAIQTGDRITVGATKAGGGAGSGISGGEEVIVSLQLRMLTSGSTTLSIVGSPPHAPAALDSSGASIASVTFESAPALLAAP